jgi:hypothetical protein
MRRVLFFLLVCACGALKVGVVDDASEMASDLVEDPLVDNEGMLTPRVSLAGMVWSAFVAVLLVSVFGDGWASSDRGFEDRMMWM